MTGVNEYCYVHYYIQQQNISGVILVYICSGDETTDDRSLRVRLRKDTIAICAKMLLSINNCGRGLHLCDVTKTDGSIWERGKDFSR